MARRRWRRRWRSDDRVPLSDAEAHASELLRQAERAVATKQAEIEAGRRTIERGVPEHPKLLDLSESVVLGATCVLALICWQFLDYMWPSVVRSHRLAELAAPLMAFGMACAMVAIGRFCVRMVRVRIAPRCEHGLRGGGVLRHCDGCWAMLQRMIGMREQELPALRAEVLRKRRTLENAVEEAREDRLGGIVSVEDLLRLSPTEFEDLVADLFRANGYEAQTTRATGDRGIDVKATKTDHRIAVQCKRYASEIGVGIDEVQRMLGAMVQDRADRCVIFATSFFTSEARRAGQVLGVKLVGGHEIIQILGGRRSLRDHV